ncbi:MAG: MBL fold metallo-hydrolase [Nitrospirae bacterium]|nr:MBL fold metallo-hydrolase [Nitrospirota bacterium]
MGIAFKRLVVGPLEVNCYIVTDESTKDTAIVDPGDEPDRLLDYINENALITRYIICTHTHFDHIGAIPELKEATKATLIIHKEDLSIYDMAKDMANFWGHQLGPLPRPDLLVSEGDLIPLGSYTFKVLHTPGHTPGGMCLLADGVLISGDTLFAGSVGRTDFPGGSMSQLKSSFRRLLTLPGETRVLPGHGPATTIADEVKDNFFIGEI